MGDGWLKYLIKLISGNKKTKKREIDIINQFEDLYNIINYYEPQNQTYEQIIENPESRLQFLSNAITVAIDNGNMDEETINIVLQMFDNLYDYFYKESELEDIEIPQQLRQKMFISNDVKTELLIPNSSGILFLITLLRENKRIYEEEFNGKDLSNKITEGLHTNITEVLSIESKDVSHMLGVNNAAYSLYEFYRKTYIDNQIASILNELNIKNVRDISNEVYIEFNKKFKELFGLDYNHNNYEKLINLKYDEIEKDLSEGKITEEQSLLLKRTYDLAPKSKAIDFYCQTGICELLIRECAKNSDFVYEYLRKEIIAKECQTLSGRNKILEKLAEKELKEIDKRQEEKLKQIDELEISIQEKTERKKEVKKKYSKERKNEINKHMSFINKIQDFNINPNKKEIRNLIDQYIELFGNTLKTNNDFQQKFKQKFGYKYPLLDYYEILGKNISFYNFSLLKNLNSIIVDYDYTTSSSEVVKSKRPKVDTFLVSYAAKKINNIKNKINDLIQKKDNDFEENASANKSDITDDYVATLKSLLTFPAEDRYYFRFGFTSSAKRSQDDKIIEKESSSDDLIYLMGFTTTEEEKNRIAALQGTGITSFSHVHKFNTNMTSNYYKYITDYTRFGIEYPIDMITSEDLIKKKKRVLKINSYGPSVLKKYVELFNNYQYNLEIGYQRSQEYEKYLIRSITSIVDGYKKVKEAKIKSLEYKRSFYNNTNYAEKYDNMIQNEKTSLNKFLIYYDEIKKYFKQYKEFFDKSLEELQINTSYQKRNR